MYRHIKTALVVAALAMTVGAGVARAGETSQIRFAAGTFSIDPQTCRFVHSEADPAMGTSWIAGRVWAAYEDGRHDAKAACNTNRQTRVIDCFTTPIPPVDERVDHQAGWADTRGVKSAVDAVREIQACVLAAGGVAP